MTNNLQRPKVQSLIQFWRQLSLNDLALVLTLAVAGVMVLG